MKKVAVLCLLSLFAIESFAQTFRSFRIGERLLYDVYFNWGIIWIRAAEVCMTTSKSPDNMLELKIAARTTKTFDPSYRIRDTLVSYTNVQKLTPIRFYQISNEDDYHVRYVFYFSKKDSLHDVTVEKIKDANSSYDSFKSGKPFYDVATTIYRLREDVDFECLLPDQKIPIDLIFNDGVYNLYWRHVGKERIKLRNKKQYDCIKIKPSFVDSKLFAQGEVMTLWISDDANRLPVMINAKMKVGSIKAMLVKSENLLHPMSSEILKK